MALRERLATSFQLLSSFLQFIWRILEGGEVFPSLFLCFGGHTQEGSGNREGDGGIEEKERRERVVLNGAASRSLLSQDQMVLKTLIFNIWFQSIILRHFMLQKLELSLVKFITSSF